MYIVDMQCILSCMLTIPEVTPTLRDIILLWGTTPQEKVYVG